MKRALAERAKQSSLPNGVTSSALAPLSEKSIPLNAPNSSSTSISNGGRSPGQDNADESGNIPQDVEMLSAPQDPDMEHETLKIEIPKQEKDLSMNSRPTPIKNDSSPRPSPSPRPKKRLRETSISLTSMKQLEEQDEEDPNASAFYLKHQNRALASELRSVKYQLSRLERERDYRRKQCSKAMESISTVEVIWKQLESSLSGRQKNDVDANLANSSTTESSAPLSTGSGTSVELIGAFLNSLARLHTSTSKTRIKGEIDDEKKIGVKEGGKLDHTMQADDDSMTEENSEETELDSQALLRITDNVAERVALLESLISSLLQKVDRAQLVNGELPTPSSTEIQNQVTQLQAENLTLQEQLNELARSRDELAESDRRVRRGLYRLAAGRVQLKEVLKAVASADEDKEAAAAWMESAAAPVLGSAVQSSSSLTSIAKHNAEQTTAEDDKETSATSKEFNQLKKQLADLNEVASARDEQIKQLLEEREENLKRINGLVMEEDKPSSGVPTNEEVQRSDFYLELTAKLAENERQVREIEERSDRIKEEWAKAIADAEFSKQTMEEMQTKHLKRWAELAEENQDIGSAEADGESRGTIKDKEIIMLQHKLTQALENVRQAESTRKTLDEAIIMNESLQAKVDELKAKYSALQTEKAAWTSASSQTNNDETVTPSFSVDGTSSAPKERPSSTTNSAPTSSQPSNDKSADKLLRDYKRVRKELANVAASKEAAKAKLERSEKEREVLSISNARLLKQATEKDEINAKSLSTILHLKQVTEQISKEKDNLEQQVKSAEQLALAARLAANARERVGEEFEKERKRLEAQVTKWEQKYAALVQEKALAEGKLAQEKAKMSQLIADAQKAKERCEELASESTRLQEDKQKMMESLAVAQREATEAANLSQRLAESQGGGLVAGFTAEQLNTQVTVLKSRLACPVCNVRDKKCILLRCRHMFCKQCVEENIKNRSRKCPACGGRFDTKDVADVWL